MAELDYAELCLPSEFLAEGFSVEAKRGKSDGDGTGDGGGASGDWCFPSEFPYHWLDGCDLGSPVESGTVTDNRGEDCVVALTRQMAHCFLEDDEKVAPSALAADDPKATRTVSSPPSTLCTVGNWNASSRETNDAPSLVSSPPSSPLGQQRGDAPGQLYSAGAHMVRVKLNEGPEKQQKVAGRGLLSPAARKSLSPFPAGLTKKATTGYYANPSLNQHQDMVEQIQQPKRQQLTEQQLAPAWRRHNSGKGGGGGLAGSRPARPLGSSAASWTPLQQQPGSGMRAVFLGAGTRRGSCGTGVFLPRRTGNPTELQKKPALSTVLLPARVMQALNLNLDDLGGAQPRFPGGFVLDRGAITARSNPMLSQRRSHRPQPVPASHHHREVCLPSEWTY